MSTAYLEAGWYESGKTTRLRTRVIDAAVDVAGSLLRDKVVPETVGRLALKVRTLLILVDPHRDGALVDLKSKRQLLEQHLNPLTDAHPTLQAFVADCLDHVESSGDLAAFYLHLLHIDRLLLLLSHASFGVLKKRAPKNGKKRKIEPTAGLTRSRSKTTRLSQLGKSPAKAKRGSSKK